MEPTSSVPAPKPANHLALRWLPVLASAAVILLIPRPSSLTPEAWRLLAIFVATVIGLIARPVPMGVIAILSITVTALTKTVTPQFALSAFANPVIWLIVSAFIFSRAVVQTGLGRRIAFWIVRSFGTSALRLGYALAGADLIVAPFIPSDTARAGGVIFPIARSLAEGFGSFPGPTARKLGAYLMQCSYHVGCTTAALFLTSMAANPLCAEFARRFAGVEITWGTWAMASLVPGAVSLAVLPWLIHRLDKPELHHTPEAREMAHRELTAMGPMSRGERFLIAILLVVIVGWVAQRWHGLHPAIIAYAGISLIVLTGVIRWEDVLEERRAWDALIWFGGLVMLADGLEKLGVIGTLTSWLSTHLVGWEWLVALLAIVLIYVLLHYGFASMTAHITALYPAFLLLSLANGVPPLLAAMALAFFSNLNASLTHYGTGPAPIFFGSGYVPLATWWRVGLLVVLFQLVIWLGLGLLWWRLIGLW